MESPRSTSPLLLPVLALSAMTIAVLQTVVVPVLAQIGAALGASPSGVGWALTANLLAAAVLTPVLGRLGDVHGRRPVLLGILAVVVAGSVLAAADGVAAAAPAGAGAAGRVVRPVPLAIGVLRDELPAERLTGAMAVVSATLGAGGGLGLVATGLLTRGGGDYHRVFWLAAAVSGLALVLAWAVVPARRPARPGASTGPAPPSSGPGWCSCCSRCPRAARGAGARRSRSAASPPPRSCSAAGSSCSTGPPTRW